MQDNLNQFIAEKNGQTVNFDGIAADSGQCVQLVALWCQRIGLPVLYNNAADWWTAYGGEFEQHWLRIDNDPNNPNQLPSPGDVVVFNGQIPGSQGYGHIDIYNRDLGVGSWEGFDSNWSGKYAHLVNHNWSYVLGWFTPRHIDPPAAPPPIEAPINVEVPAPVPPPVEAPPLPYVPPAAPVPFPYDTTPYTIIKSIFGFDTATDAGNQANAKQSVEAGDYFVYKRYPGNAQLINVTKTLGTAGTWIDADYNVPDVIPEPTPEPLPPEPIKTDWPLVRELLPKPEPLPVAVTVVPTNFRSSYKAFPKPIKYVIQKDVLISEIGTQGKDVMLYKGGRDHPNYMLIYGTFSKDDVLYGRPKLASDVEFIMWYGVPLLMAGRSPNYIEEDIIEIEDIPTYAKDTVQKAQVELHAITDFLPFAVGKLTHYLTFVQQLLIGKNK